jgi:CheY-like chemotaxis protein
MTVLIAHKHPLIIAGISAVLEKMGYQVRATNSFQDAQTLVESVPSWDAFICGDTFGGKAEDRGDGARLARRTLQEKHIPSIIVSDDPTACLPGIAFYNMSTSRAMFEELIKKEVISGQTLKT